MNFLYHPAKFQYIPDLFEPVIAKVNTALALKGFTQTVFYDKGHYSEIVVNLTEKDKAITKTGKYPLVWLVKDFKQVKPKRTDLYCEIPDLKLIIATDTDINYSEDDRKIKTFGAILYPVMAELINQISLSSTFCMPSEQMLVKDWWERSYWGRGNANIFNDFADVIELNLRTDIKNICISNQYQITN